MGTSERRASRWTLLIASVLAVYIGLAVAVPPGIVPDAARGFMVWPSMPHGAAFNVVRELDANDITRGADAFMTWWTLGRYAVPSAFTAYRGRVGRLLVALPASLGELSRGDVFCRQTSDAP